MKKFSSFILAFLMLFSLSNTSYAVEAPQDNKTLYVYSKNCPTEFVEFADEHIGALLASSEFANLTDCELGAPFTFDNADSDIFYFPVYHNGKIICTLRVFETSNGSINAILSQMLASDLEEAANHTSPTVPLKVHFDGQNIVFQIANKKHIAFSYPQELEESTGNELSPSGKNITEFVTVSCAPISTIATPETRAIPSSKTLNLFLGNTPVETQGDTSWCCGYVTAMIMRFKGVNVFARDVMAAINGPNPPEDEGAYYYEINSYARQMGFDTAVDYSPTYAELCAEIAEDRPVYMAYEREVGSGSNVEHYRHAVAMFAYNQNFSSATIWNPHYTFSETLFDVTQYTPINHNTRHYELDLVIDNWTL